MKTRNIVCPGCNAITDIKPLGENPICSTCKESLHFPFALDVSDESCQIHIDNNEIPVLVDFHSPVCAPCVAMEEDYEDAALGFNLKVRFLKINADDFQEVAKKYKVSGLPTIISFVKGKEVNRISTQLSQVQLSIWAKNLSEL